MPKEGIERLCIDIECIHKHYSAFGTKVAFGGLSKNMNNVFFELIQVALGNHTELSCIPSAEEWVSLYIMAENQALIGVCFYGVQRLPVEQTRNLSMLLKMQWLGRTMQIQQMNEAISNRCKDLYKMLKTDGYESCLLKGQAFATLYGSALSIYRQSGDIDIWMLAEPRTAIEWARKTKRLYYYDYHHADLNIFPETVVELHYRPSISRNLVRNAQLQKWFVGEGREHILFNEELRCNVPDATFSVILALNHNFWHLLYEGVGLRQMMDLYFVAKAAVPSSMEQISREVPEICALKLKTLNMLIKYFGLTCFASASAWVCWHLFDGEREDSLFLQENSPLPQPDAKAGRFLLDEIMQAGNFGHHDVRIRGAKSSSRMMLMFRWIKHTFRLVKFYPVDVLWTPIGILRLSFWRRFKYMNERNLRNVQ